LKVRSLEASRLEGSFILFAHAAGLALSVWTIVRSGDRTQVLLYAQRRARAISVRTIFDCNAARRLTRRRS